MLSACSQRGSPSAGRAAQQPGTAAPPAALAPPAGDRQDEHRLQDGAAPPPCLQTETSEQLPPKKLRSVRGASFYSRGRRGAAVSSGRLPTAAEAAFEARLQRSLQLARERAERWKAEEAEGLERAAHVWEEFPTQQPAFERADSQPGLEVFSVEVNTEGKRRFIATSRELFWKRYCDMMPEHRHYYEIIRQGRPCHLYFDLEFATTDNPGLDGKAATDAVVALVGEKLRGAFQLEMQPGWVLELDSSTEAKFSRHLVIRIPDAAFASSAHVGAFVLQLCAAARERRGEDPRAALLTVTKGDEEALFVDPAVYSRNRAFRLYLSSKKGKQAVLHNTGRYGGAMLSQHQMFEASLITAVEPGARLLRSFDEAAEEEAEGPAAARRRALRGAAAQGAPGGGLLGVAACYGPCPYPALEEFITSVCCEGGMQGRVRSWAALEDDLLLFTMRDNRFCSNVGRPHKSNGIYYVVDLRGGSWCQKCFDPDCRHYRSPLAPLPPHLLGLLPPQQPDALALLRPAGRHHCPPGSAQPSGWPSAVTWAGGRSSSASDGELTDDEESLMLQAVESYELSQAQQAQQQQQLEAATGPNAAAGPGAAAAAEAPRGLGQAAELTARQEPADDDELLLEALLQYEMQSGNYQPGAATASPALLSLGMQQVAASAPALPMPALHTQQVAMSGPSDHAAAPSSLAPCAQPALMQHPAEQRTNGQQQQAQQQWQTQQWQPQPQQPPEQEHQHNQQDPARLCGTVPTAAGVDTHQCAQHSRLPAWPGLDPQQQCRQGLPGRHLGRVQLVAERPLEVWEKFL
ncbi:hypothetical protein ABPG77_010579 [Micractinium sp. CCAP 211/92]